MTQELIIIRGLPGSGKSRFAKLITSFDGYDYQDIKWIETDMFFMQIKSDYKDLYYDAEIDEARCKHPEDFNYVFDASKIVEAHAWCQKTVWNWLQKENAIVIVSNTFSRIWEMQPYIDMAWKMDCKFTVIEVQGNHGNVHDVPETSMNKMKARWEKYSG